ncbi:MAG: CAP domain-containing protein [Hyphomicrobiales bacterium]
MADPTVYEQLILELINRARLDPATEAARLGIDLNKDLPAGTLTPTQKQPLAFNGLINNAADSHSQWMLSTNTFSHTGVNGSTPWARMAAAGYTLTGSWTAGENIAWVGTTGTLDIASSTRQSHDNLFKSAGHRENILNDAFREIGIGTVAGKFSGYNALMTTEDFGKTGTAKFLTGVVINDLNDNQFYDLGEGLGGVAVTARNGGGTVASGTTWAAGGYSLSIASDGTYDILFSGSGIAAETGVTVNIAGANVKVDLADNNTLTSSVSATMLAGALNLKLLGINSIDGTGNGLDNTITGNAGNNVLTGGDGNDTLIGNGGNDTLIGGLGNDVLKGGAGVDILQGGAGDDIVYADSSDNLALLSGGDGTDTLYFSGTVNFDWQALGFEILNPDQGGSVIGGGTPPVQPPPGPTEGPDTLTGSDVDETMMGLGGNDVLKAMGGNDTLDGGSGADQMSGGLGDDTYVVDNAADKVIELAGQGNDTVITSLASYSLATLGAVENLTYDNGAAADANFTGTGNALSNTITGGDGNDRLTGGLGADILIGGNGDDTYIVDNPGDVVTELPNGGTDTVLSSVSYVLGDGVENLTLTGKSAINGTGNDLDNTIVGTAAANVLDGGAGADTMRGGAGNDTYIVDSSNDVVIELAKGGIDTVRASASFTLGANVENLVLTGSEDINGTGNALANTITGNDGDNVLNGGAGIDRMAGGLGDDTYIVDNTRDVVTELDGQGTDTIITSLSSYSLATRPAVENLTYDNGVAPDAAFTGAGNALDNVIKGGAGNDKLSGGVGNDTLIGGDGADSLSGGLGSDHFVFAPHTTAATDTITDFDITDVIDVSAAFGFADDIAVMGALTVVGADLKLTLDANTSVLIKGAAALGLTEANFDII